MNNVIAYNKDMISGRGLVSVIGVVFFVVATSLSAYVRVPVPASPVPITLQTFFVLMSGAVLGRRLGGISQIGYIFLGAMGLPVFQGAGFGLAYIIGPTGGYLAGFVAASFAVGCLCEGGRCGIARIVAAFLAGSMIIYVAGSSWLVFFCHMTPAGAFAAGVLPFIPGDMIKILSAACLYSGISDRSRAIFSA